MIRLLSILIIGVSFQLYAQSNYNYTETFNDFPNPERGFYRYSETSSSNYTLLNANTLRGYRDLNSVFSADYQVMSTLVFRYFVLDNFVNGPMNESFLNNIKSDFEAAREGGVKLIPRFVYTTTANSGACGDICPPYGDAPKDIVLQHIAQLKPIFQEYSDVIAVLQIGFIGIWGEQYYTDYFGFPSSDGGDGVITNENWIKRNEVIDALLDALPTDRMLQVRYPQQKQRYVYGVNAPTTSAPLSEAEAFNESDKARIGLHNDCFLSSWTDVGTYSDYGNDNESFNSDTTNLKPYLAQDSRFTPVGGETCRDQFSPYNKCEGFAVEEMDRMNYSYLNAHYNNDVNNHWVTGGCIDEIKRRLGYRFVLRSSALQDEVIQGGSMEVNFNIDNVGFTSLFNPRKMELVLRNTNDNSNYYIPFSDIDIRFWQKGNHSVNKNLPIPDSIPSGEYECLLSFPDAAENLYNNPDYSIRLANEGLWEASTGFNKLNHTLTITAQNTDLCNTFNVNIDGETDEWLNIPVYQQYNNSYMKVFDDPNYLSILIEGNTNINNQFFIDMDGDVNTGYSSLAWNDFGADYHIENGTLSSYSGSGIDDWTWDTEGTIDYVLDSNIIELRIDKSVLNSSIFKIGYRNLDTTWTIAFNLPNEGTLNTYSYQCQITSSENINKQEIKVFPTLVNQEINIQFSENLKGAKVTISASDGKIIKTKILEERNNIIALNNNLAKGIYLVTIETESKIQTFRFIKN